MTTERNSKPSRRQFLAQTALGSMALLGAPAILTASKTDSKLVLGEGDYRYEVTHNWPQLPDEFKWQTTHGVAVDKAGCIYIIHEGDKEKTDHPSIFVFDPAGKYIRSFGKAYQGGGHGIEVHEENGKEFLYVCNYQSVKNFVKLDLQGEEVWRRDAPMASKRYRDGEDTNHEAGMKRDCFQPTNIAFLDDGGFLLADGYGAFCVHRYDRDANWVSVFGAPGKGEGTFNTPHGIWVDRRFGREPSIVICDRANNTLQLLDMDGKYQKTIEGFGLPANIDTWKNLMVVPELHARVSILNEKNEVVARLGDDVARITGKGGGNIRRQPRQWKDGKFVHPHDACFTQDGDILVAEWVATGRMSLLKRLS